MYVYIHVYNYTPYNVPVVVACKVIVLCCYNFTRRKYIYIFTAAIISPFTRYYVLPEGSALVPHLIIRTFHVQSHAERHDHAVFGIYLIPAVVSPPRYSTLSIDNIKLLATDAPV